VTWFVLGVCLLVAFLLAVRGFVNADPKKMAEFLRKSGGGLAVLLALVFLFTGNIALAIPLVMVAFLILNGRTASPFRMFRFPGGFPGGFAGGSRPSPGQSSDVETDWLEMRLDHDSGEISGRIRKGRFAGRDLSDLGVEQLLDVLQECRDHGDDEGAQLLEAYLDRVHGDDWRYRDGPHDGKGGDRGYDETGQMTRDEAYEVLGLAPGATEAEIKEAHRRLMKNMHPDMGGSEYLARKINQAKDFLLKIR
jgi:hypothetical protein